MAVNAVKQWISWAIFDAFTRYSAEARTLPPPPPPALTFSGLTRSALKAAVPRPFIEKLSTFGSRRGSKSALSVRIFSEAVNQAESVHSFPDQQLQWLKREPVGSSFVLGCWSSDTEIQPSLSRARGDRFTPDCVEKLSLEVASIN